MTWPYHFVTLSSEQQHERRRLLDFYASLAQLSVLVPLLAVQVFRLSVFLSPYLAFSSKQTDPSSPVLKEKRQKHSQAARSLATTWRRIEWWYSSPAYLGSYSLGTYGEVTGAIVWCIWLLALCVLQTGEDYLHLTKRFGIVAASQLPLHYLLTVKSRYSPLLLLTGRSHESLNPLHQLLGRIITLLFFLHAAFYLNFYVLSNLLTAKLKEFYVLCGLAAIIGFAAIGTTALAPLRRRSYRLFYIVHVVLATTIPIVLFFHVTHIRIYLYETAMVFLANAILRTTSSKTVPARIRAIPGSNLIEILIRLPKARLLCWNVGQHAYLSLPPAWRRIGGSNPFTASSVPSVDGALRFVARVQRGNTLKLAQATTTRDDITSDSLALSLEGPYGLSTHSDRLLTFDRVFFVAGGVGATFIVPLYRQLLADLSPSKGSRRRRRVSFLWIAKSLNDVAWSLPEDEKEREGFVERLRVCLTAAAATTSNTAGVTVSPSSLTFGEDGDANCGAGLGDGHDEMPGAVELEERATLLPDEVSTDDKERAQQTIRPYAGRPDLPQLIRQVFVANSTNEKVAIMVCGPQQLAEDLRREVTPYVLAGRSVWFWNEQFSM